MLYRLIVVLCLLLLPACGADSAPDPAASCRDLVGVDVADTQLKDIEFISDKAGLSAFCQVTGLMVERVGFVLRLPAKGWNGKFAVAGCGGFCGSLRPDKPGYSNSMNESLRLGYAVIQTDGGHEAESFDTDWAIGDPRALQLYAGEWMPLAVATGTKLVDAYYSNLPSRTYFSGCSNGGRLGMYAAQRYPELFDGIAAGGGIFDLTGNAGVHGLWKLQTTLDEHGGEVIDRGKLPLLAAQVMRQCDALDGVQDNVISRPLLCQPELDNLRCADAAGDQCFTDPELAAIKRLYRGATVNGKQLFTGIPPGSESLWSNWIVGSTDSKAWGTLASEGNLRLTYGIPSDQPFHPHDYDLAKELENLERLAPVLNATDPDLSGLEAAGGKLFYYHGLADPLILAGRVDQYYAQAVAVMGRDRLDKTARFFMVPGQGHCWEKPGQVADDFNPLVVIDAWVEGGVPPEQVIAVQKNSSGDIVRSRKLCPMPKITKLTGDDQTQAASYDCVNPI